MKQLQSIIHFSIKFFLFVFVFLAATNVYAESKRDTLVYKAWRDTVRLQKAHVIDIDSDNSMLYFRPKPFQFAKHVPQNIYQLGKTSFSKKNLPKLGIILAGTGLLIAVDQPIANAAKQFGRYINLDPSRKSKTLIAFKVGGFQVNAMEIPDNTNSAIYYLGEGWASMLIAGGFYGYGLLANDYRAIQTTSQIAETIFTLGFTTQFLKRITGRQSPFRADIPGGDWHPFPAPAKYQKSVSNFDAFPSGHMATAMATVTILAGNYPESKYIKPVGYSLMGLLGFSMLNNDVHWISDYPLAIAIGYSCGKIAVARGRKMIAKKDKQEKGKSSSILPMFFGAGNIGLSYRATF